MEPEPDKKAQERKKIVQDLIKKNEPCSSVRKLNEQRRMEFFSQDNSTSTVELSDIDIPIDEVSEEPSEENVKPVEKQITVKNTSMEAEVTAHKKEKTPEIITKKSCVIL